MENISEIDTFFCGEIIKQCKLFKVLLNGMRKKQEYGIKFDEIQLYMSEILCIYLQPMDDDDNEEGMAVYDSFASIKGVDKILDLLQSKYLKKDPTLSEEGEYVSNLMDSLCAALASTVNQNKFHESPSAFNILLTLIKSKRYTKMGCLRALSFAVTNHSKNCVKLVECGGLKTIFSEFMNRKKIKKKYKRVHDKEKMEEYLCSILVHLFCNLSDVNLLRLMHKFREKDCEKIDRLIEMHAKYVMRMEDNESKEKTKGLIRDEDERYSQRLENGLYCLQMIDILIAFIYTMPHEDGNTVIKERIVHGLNQSDNDIEEVKETLREYYDITHPQSNKNDGDDDSDDNDMSLGAIAGKLVKLM